MVEIHEQARVRAFWSTWVFRKKLNALRLLRKGARALGITAVAKRVLPSSFLTSVSVALNSPSRAIIAAKYLTGEGLEIGALHSPLKLPPGASAKYVDVLPLDKLLNKYPELGGLRITPPDLIDDGFTLGGVPDASQSFVISNHVLEHSPNPLMVLENWARVLKPGGVLFVTVPVGNACFDRGRLETTMEHFVEDYELCRKGDSASFLRRNFEHYLEWVSISEVNQGRDAGNEAITRSRADAESRARALADRGEDIHFHTFSADSFARFAQIFLANAHGSVSLEEVVDLGDEVVGVFRKSIAGQAE